MEQQFDFTVSDLASKWRNKTEIYNVLTRDGKLYLPQIKDCTQKFLRAIMRGEKLYIKCNDVRVITVPQYWGLKVEDILKFASTSIRIKLYLPDYNYSKEPNREWIWNVVNSLIPKDFQKFIKRRKDERRVELLSQAILYWKWNLRSWKSSNHH